MTKDKHSNGMHIRVWGCKVDEGGKINKGNKVIRMTRPRAKRIIRVMKVIGMIKITLFICDEARAYMGVVVSCLGCKS